MLLECLRLVPLWTKLTTKKVGTNLDLYQPNLVSRQFDLSQLLPKPLVRNMKGMVLFIDDTKEETLEVFLEYFRYQLAHLPFFA